MVPATVTRRAAVGAIALTALAACGGERPAPADAFGEDTTAAGRAVRAVRGHYTARDLAAAGAWTWTAADGAVFVLVDAQSTVEDLVQGRADLWMVLDTTALPVGRSDVMPSAAEFGAYSFDDLTGDGLPDLFGYVADSAEVSYPVFLPGARGGMTDEIAAAAPGWRFSTGDDRLPRVVSGPAGACALQLWAEEPTPDGQAEGWRYLPLHPGALGAPLASPPACGTPAGAAGVQQGAPNP